MYQQSTQTPRLASVGLAFITFCAAAILAGCNGDDNGNAEEVKVDEDAVEAVVEILDLVEQEEWEAFRDRLTPVYSDVSTEAIREVHGATRVLASIYAENFDGTADEWDSHDHGVGVLANLQEEPSWSVVLTAVEGTWRLDRGPHTLEEAKRIEAGDQLPAQPAYVVAELEAESIDIEQFDLQETDPGATAPEIGIGVHSMVDENDVFTLNLVLQAQNMDRIVLDPEAIEILSDTDNDTSDLIWTNAKWADAQIVPIQTPDGTSVTEFSLQIGEATAEDDSAELEISEIQVASIEDPDEQGIVTVRVALDDLLSVAP